MQIPRHYKEHFSALAAPEAVWSYRAMEKGQTIILPDGRCDIIARFTRGNADVCHEVTPILTGPATRPYSVSYSPDDGWIGLRMRPALASAFWGDQIQTAKDTVLIGQESIRAALLDFRITLPKNGTSANILSGLEEISRQIQNWQTDIGVEKLLKNIHVSGGRLSVAELAGLLPGSERQVNRIFRQTVGLSPKIYSRLIQFHRALRLMRDHGLSGVQASSEAGYADQAHMVRSFRQFGGFVPSRIPDNLTLPGFSAAL